ncbi:MAG TPA: cupin domain-containing protein, partial [Candidatus Dormibacteraeota bacterium]|nr:cupin domain-containing protein [Candidatus Dormibacteraeota bacterium]
MNRKPILVALLVLGALLAVGGTALATASSGFAGATLAKATYGDIFSHAHTIPAAWDELISTKGSSDLYVQQNTWQPGGSTGWHTHPGPSFVIVTKGSVTVYDGDDPACTPHVFTAGTPDNAFIDRGAGHVHLVRNETKSVAQAIAVQLIPSGAVRRQDAA